MVQTHPRFAKRWYPGSAGDDAREDPFCGVRHSDGIFVHWTEYLHINQTLYLFHHIATTYACCYLSLVNSEELPRCAFRLREGLISHNSFLFIRGINALRGPHRGFSF